jgi:hypothetical protein
VLTVARCTGAVLSRGQKIENRNITGSPADSPLPLNIAANSQNACFWFGLVPSLHLVAHDAIRARKIGVGASTDAKAASRLHC